MTKEVDAGEGRNNLLVWASAASVALMGFVLPLFEAPKNIAAVLVFLSVLVWMAFNRRTLVGGFGKEQLFMVVWSVAVLFGGLLSEVENGWNFSDELRMYLLCAFLMAVSFDENRVRFVLTAFFIGFLLAWGWGGWQFYVAHSTKYWQLNSVGHVNQSAIYVVEMFAVVLAYCVHMWPRVGLTERVIGVLTLVASAWYLIFGESRAALLAAMVVVVFFAVMNWRLALKKRKALAIILAVVVLVVGVVGTMGGGVRAIQKQVHNAGQDNVLSFRDKIWDSGIDYVNERNALFGIGKDQFIKVPVKGGDFVHISHAHNAFVQRYVEQGFWGLGWFCAFLIVYTLCSVRCLRRYGVISPALKAFGQANLALIVVLVVVGMFNTTLRFEHGLLVMVMFALMRGMGRSVKPVAPAS